MPVGDVELRVLGPVELSFDGVTVAIGGPIARCLLVHLALSRNQFAPDGATVDALWGEDPPDTVDAALRVHVSKVRGALASVGRDIERRHGGYAIVPMPLPTDLDRLSALESVITAADTPQASLSAIERALHLWRGAPLADVRRFELASPIAMRLDERRAVLERARASLLVQLGRESEVVGWLDRQLATDPLDEGSWALLATAAYRTNGSAAALRVLGRARSALRDEAGLDPGDEIRQLEVRILQQDPHLLAAPVELTCRPIPPALTVRQPATYVGRSVELAELAGHLDAAKRSGRSFTVTVSGETGMGKTALAAQFAALAAEAGATTLYGWCEPDTAVGFGALADLVVESAHTGPWEVDGASSGDPALRRRLAIEAGRRALTAIAAVGPVVLIVDDLQWADDLTRALLVSIARTPLVGALMILVLRRAGSGSGDDIDGALRCALAGLTPADVKPWAAAAELDPDELIRLSAGIPSVVIEIVRTRSEGGDPVRTSELAGQRMFSGALRTLDASARRATRAAAVLGTRFEFDALVRVLGIAGLQLATALDDAATAGVIEFDDHLDGVYRFRHDFVRTAVLAALSSRHRRELHLRALRATDAQDDRALGRLIYARGAGGLVGTEELVDLTERAAMLLCGGLLFERATAELQTTMLTADGSISRLGRARLLIALAIAVAGNDPAAARAHVVEALAIGEGLGDAAVVGAALVAGSRFGYRYDVEKTELDRLTWTIDNVDDIALKRQLLMRLTFEHLHRGELAPAARALTTAESVDHSSTSVADRTSVPLRHLLAELSGDRQGRAQAAEWARVHASDGLLELQIEAATIRIVELLHAGEFAAADASAEALEELGRRVGEPHTAWLGSVVRFAAPFCAGRLGDAARAADTSLEFGISRNVLGARAAHAGQQFALSWVNGQLAPYVEPLQRVSVGGHDLQWRGALALALAQTGRIGEAGDVLAQLATDVVTSADSWLGFVGVAVAVEAASLVGARDVLAAAEPALRRRIDDHVLLGMGAVDYGPVRRLLGLVLAGTDRIDDGNAELQAVSTSPASGVLWRRRARLDLARLRGDRVAPADSELQWSWMRE